MDAEAPSPYWQMSLGELAARAQEGDQVAQEVLTEVKARTGEAGRLMRERWRREAAEKAEAERRERSMLVLTGVSCAAAVIAALAAVAVLVL
jgi:hypothetical protein